MPHKSGMGAIFGIVSENGIAKSASPVYLMDMQRDLGVGQAKVLAKQTTKSDGGFVFNGLDPNYTDYSIMASDEDGLEPKNALIQDRVQPIPTTAGLGALGDWYTRIFKDGAVSGFVNIHTTETPAKPLGIAGSVLYTGTPAETGVSMDVSEMPSIASVITSKTGSISSYGRSKGGVLTDWSLEILLDIDSFRPDSEVMSVVMGGLSPASATNPKAVSIASNLVSESTLIGYVVSYNPANKSLGVSAITSIYAGYATRSVVGSVQLSVTGIRHIVLSFVAGSSLSIFIDGVLLSKINTTVKYKAEYGDTASNFMIVGGASSGDYDFYIGGVYNIGLSVGYPLALTDGQVLNHYKSLYANNLVPLTSGYQREVMASLPSWYYRFDEIDLTKGLSGEVEHRSGVDNLSPPRSLLTVSDPYGAQMLIDSPILGKNTFKKTASQLVSGSRAGLFGFTFTNQFSFSCWVNLSLITPVATEKLINFESFTTTDPFFLLSRNTNGKLSATVRGAVSVETFNFNYIPPAETWVNIWIVVDKRITPTPLLKLYVGTEAGEIALVEQLAMNMGELYTPKAHVGEAYPGDKGLTVQVGGNMSGSLCELAMFHNAISEDRIKEIWASKDTP